MMTATVKVIPGFTDIIDGKAFKKDIAAAYPVYLINAIKDATHPNGKTAYPLKFVKEAKEAKEAKEVKEVKEVKIDKGSEVK